MEKPPRNWSKVQRKKAPYQVTLRLTPEEHDRLTATAEALGVSKAGYIKSVVFAQPIPKAARRPKTESADLSQLLGWLGKLGGNANQIAHLCNRGTITEAREALDAVQGIRSELVTMRAALLEALGGKR